MPAYAKGTHAWGQCGRCGGRKKLADMQLDGYIKNLLVCRPCRDIAHPQEKPFKADDASILRRPAPDVDDDSVGASGVTIATALGGTNYFGGGT